MIRLMTATSALRPVVEIWRVSDLGCGFNRWLQSLKMIAARWRLCDAPETFFRTFGETPPNGPLFSGAVIPAGGLERRTTARSGHRDFQMNLIRRPASWHNTEAR
jgi:hypothetical protein